MNILLVLLAALTPQAGSLLQQVIPQPTGDNGYEEYLRAADAVSTKAFKEFKQWNSALDGGSSPGQAPSGLSETSTPLERKGYEVRTFGSALKLIAAGNAKPTERGANALMVEFSRFNDLTNLGVDSAYVSFAKGDWKAGVDVLLEVLAFGNNVGREYAIGLLIGSNIMRKALVALCEHKSQWSAADCERIANRVGDLLAKPSPIHIAIEREERFELKNVEALFSEGSLVTPDDPDDKVGIELNARLKSLTQAERGQLKTLVLDRIKAMFVEHKARLQKPEGEWLSLSPKPEETAIKLPLKTLDDVARAQLKDLYPSEELFDPALRTRTQLRLLKLHAEIQMFRWQHGRLPAQLGEVTSDPGEVDPLKGEAFSYQQQPHGYKLVSKGTRQTGEIDLSPPKAQPKVRFN